MISSDDESNAGNSDSNQSDSTPTNKADEIGSTHSPLSSQTPPRPPSTSAWPPVGASFYGSSTAGRASFLGDDGCDAAFSVGARQAGFGNASDLGQFFDLSTQTFLTLTNYLRKPKHSFQRRP